MRTLIIGGASGGIGAALMAHCAQSTAGGDLPEVIGGVTPR